MTVKYVSLNSIAKEMYDEEDPPSKSKLADYQRTKREQFIKVMDFLGLNLEDYQRKIKVELGEKDNVEYDIPEKEKVMIKYWIKNYQNSGKIKKIKQLKNKKKRCKKIEEDSLNQQIKIAKEEAFIEMSYMIINEYRNNYKELTSILDILFSKYQYFFYKLSENLYIETSKIMEPIFNNLRGELSNNDIDTNQYQSYKLRQGERPLRLISQKESIILLLMYKDKIKKLGQELDEIVRIVEEINLDKISDVFSNNNQETSEALSNIKEAIKDYRDNKQCTIWDNTDFTDYNEEYIKNLLKDIKLSKKIGHIEVSTTL